MSTSLGPAPRVTSDGVAVRINDLTCTDPDLLALLFDAADPEPVVQLCLATGARGLRVIHASADAAVVERAFNNLQEQLVALLDNTTSKISGTASDLMTHPEHGLVASLDAWQADLARLIDDMFDPQHADGALARVDAVLRDASERQLAATRRLLNPDSDESPLARLLTGVRDQIATVLDAVGRLSQQVSADRAAAAATTAAMERSAVKGLVFEEQVGVAVTALAAERGDEVEHVGSTSGTQGGKVGDLLVTVDPIATGGRTGSYVLECKDRQLSFKATMAELHRAMTNREALAGVAVFSSTEKCPVASPFAVFNERAVAVFDKDDPNPAALRLACAWARWVVQRETRTSETAIDIDLIARLIDDARRALDRVSTIKRAHATATKKIAEATDHVRDLGADLSSVLDQIEEELARGERTSLVSAAG